MALAQLAGLIQSRPGHLTGRSQQQVRVINLQTVERRTITKISWRLLPLIVIIYFVAYIDRTNVSFAALTMNKDLGLSPYVFGWGAGIFFLGYFLFEVPSNVILEKVGARIWIARIMITWGLVSGAMAFASGPASFLTLRFLLGVLKSTYFLVKILVWLRPKSNCSMKITRLNCRHGLAQKLLARIDTTTAPLRNIHTVRGFARMQRWLPNNANGTTSIDVSLPPREVGFGLQRRNSITKKYPRVHFGLGAVTPLQINCRSSAMPV